VTDIQPYINAKSEKPNSIPLPFFMKESISLPNPSSLEPDAFIISPDI
jgi:hypothetical protein